MSIKIAEAYSDENKKAKGGQAGDQTGREIFVRDWYERTGDWEVYLEPTDRDMAEAAAATAVDIAEDDSFGYDQGQRWTGAEAIASAPDIFSAEDSEFDCSSLIDTVYAINGLEIDRGYTGNLEQRYVDAGFIAHREPKYLTSGKHATVGGLYLTAGKHVMIVVEADENPAETEADNDYAQPALDDSTPPYVQAIGTVRVRKSPETPTLTESMTAKERAAEQEAHKRIYTTKDRERLPYLATDPTSGWYQVESPCGTGWITNKTQYTRLVTE